MAKGGQDPATMLATGIEALDLDLSEEVLHQLLGYLLELKKWNAKINLVGPGSDQQLIETHFIDSLTLLPLLENTGNRPMRLIDVGTGAGFPGLVLKTALPLLDLTLVEPRSKRVSFLKQICRSLGLTGVSIISQRLPEDGSGLTDSQKFHVAVSRALSRIHPFLVMAAPLLDTGGQVICMKGPQANEELREWQEQSLDSPFQHISSRKLFLPFSKAERSLLVFEKKR